MTENDIRKLRDEVDLLREELRQLRDKLCPPDNPFLGKLRLTAQEAAVLLCLYKSDIATTEALDAVTLTYGYKNNVRSSEELCLYLRTKVVVCKIRAKLKVHGIKFKCVFRVGYSMDFENKTKLRKLVEKSK